MRERRLPTTPSVLALALVALLVTPFAASAASGLPSTITMTPERAGPGSQVEIVGLDFPAGRTVDLRLTTTAGAVHLATTAIEEGGYFRQSLELPADVAPGFWELRATSDTGAVAVHIFEATSGPAAAVVDTAAAQDVAVEPAASSGMFGSNLLVLLVLAVLIGVVGGAVVYVWRQMRRPEGEPGMGSGDDPIWSGATTETQ